MTSRHTSSRPTTRTRILVELKDTCNTLDKTIKSYTERKCKLEILIKVLSEEEGIVKGDGTSEEYANEEGSDEVMMKTLPAVMRTEALWFFIMLLVLLFFFPKYYCT